MLLSRIGLGGGVVGVMEQQVDRRLTDAEIYERHAADLVRFAASITGASESEDVVATALARLFPSAGWRSASNQEAYLYRAVLNAARSHLRSQSRRQRRERKVAFDRARDVNWQPVGPDISFALDALSPRQRAVVHLTYWEERTGAEIAERLGISEGSVRKHLARAKESLRRLIDG